MNTEDKFYCLRPGQIPRDNDLTRHNRRMLVEAVSKARSVGLIDIPEFKAAVAALNSVSSITQNKLYDLEYALTKAIKEEGFARPGQPDEFRRATDDEIENLLLEAESLIDDGFPSKAIPFLRKASNSIDMHTDAKLKKVLADLMREANVRFSRPGQPERFGLEDACWDGYEPVGTKQKDGRTVPNCVPMSKDTHAADDRSADFLRKMAVGVTPSNIKQMQIVVSQALAYGQGKRDTMLIEEAKAAQAEINELKKAGH
jgi:hypothetical protein